MPDDSTTQANPPTAGAAAPPPAPVRGLCHVFLGLDVATSIDLSQAERLLRDRATRPNLKHRFRTPDFIAYEPAPLRVRQATPDLPVGSWNTSGSLDITLFDFGAASVVYRIPFEGTLESLGALSDALQDHAGLREDARAKVQALIETIAPAIQRPLIAAALEDYAVFVIEPGPGQEDVGPMLTQRAGVIARILRGDTPDLSDQEIKDALASRLSFTRYDAAVIDWSAAVVFDAEPDDVLAILEFANVELLEMRHLDDRLDTTLASSYDTLARQRWWRWLMMGSSRDLRRIAAMQTDSALMFEGVNNAIKLVGDQYLARLYRAAATRMGVPEWQASVRRKLATLESISSRVADHGSTLRIEILEWIIVLLIAFEVVMSFVR